MPHCIALQHWVLLPQSNMNGWSAGMHEQGLVKHREEKGYRLGVLCGGILCGYWLGGLPGACKANPSRRFDRARGGDVI